MRKKLAVVSVAMMLCACSSTYRNSDRAPVVEAIGSQKLSTNFTRQGVKLEWDCSWGTGFSDATCVKGDVKAIEVTAYAPSFGNSEANREAAFAVAHDMALVKLNRFIQDDISSTRVTTTLTKNVEKANDKLKSRIGDGSTS